MEPTAPKDGDLPSKNLLEKDDGRAWKKTDDIPRRFDELSPEEDEWIPVASVIRAQREEIAKREAQEIKIKPPLEPDFEPSDSKPKHNQNPVKQDLEIKKEPIKEESKHIQTKEDANMNPEILNEDKTESDEEVDAVTRAMIDWGLKTSVTYDLRKKSKALDQPSYQNSPHVSSSSNVDRFSKAPSDNYKQSYETEHASSSLHSRDDEDLHQHDYNRQEKQPESTNYSSPYYERTQNPEHHKDPISDRRYSYYPEHHKDPISDRRHSYYDQEHHKDPISDRRYSYYPEHHKDPISDRRHSYYDHEHYKDPISDRRHSYYDQEHSKDPISDRRHSHHDPEPDYNRGHRQDLYRDHRQYGGQGQAYRHGQYHESDPYYKNEDAHDPRREYKYNKQEQYHHDKHGYGNYRSTHPNYDHGHDPSHNRGHDLGY